MKIGVVFGSSRDNGNTETLTKHALEGIDYTSYYLKNYKINPIDDLRHEPGGFVSVDDDYEELIKEILTQDILVFATPVYWYGMSGIMKNFVDRFSQSLRDETIRFKEKMASKKIFITTVGGDNPRIKALPLIQQFQYIFQFLGTEVSGYLIGKANAPSEILEDERSMTDAKEFQKLLYSKLDK